MESNPVAELEESNRVQHYMNKAVEHSKLSSAEKLKVGAIILQHGFNIVGKGYNRIPDELSSISNECEYREYFNSSEQGSILHYPLYDMQFGYYRLKTRKEVIHAEADAIISMARNGNCTNLTELFVTVCPCVECAKLIMISGISSVYYKHDYKNEEGLNLLKNSRIKVVKV